MKQLLNLTSFRFASVWCFYTTLETGGLLILKQSSSKMMTLKNPLILFYYILHNPYMASNNKVILSLDQQFTIQEGGNTKTQKTE